MNNLKDRKGSPSSLEIVYIPIYTSFKINSGWKSLFFKLQELN